MAVPVQEVLRPLGPFETLVAELYAAFPGMLMVGLVSP